MFEPKVAAAAIIAKLIDLVMSESLTLKLKTAAVTPIIMSGKAPETAKENCGK
jgi:hypothetical protein